MPDDPSKPAEKPATSDLQKAVDDLKARIAEARGRNDMPLNANLGNPNWEKRAADGHLDLPEEED